MLIVSSINETRRVQKSVELGDDIRRAVDVLPGILTGNIFTIGCLPLLTTLLRYWALLLLTLYVLAFFTVHYRYLTPKYQDMIADPTKGRVAVGRIEINEYEVVLQLLRDKIFGLILIPMLTCLTITANLYPSLKLPLDSGLFWQVNET